MRHLQDHEKQVQSCPHSTRSPPMTDEKRCLSELIVFWRNHERCSDERMKKKQQPTSVQPVLLTSCSPHCFRPLPPTPPLFFHPPLPPPAGFSGRTEFPQDFFFTFLSTSYLRILSGAKEKRGHVPVLGPGGAQFFLTKVKKEDESPHARLMQPHSDGGALTLCECIRRV